MRKRDLVVCEAEHDGCSGWRAELDCPNDGNFDAKSLACKECCEDAMKALDELMKGEDHAQD